MNERIKELAEQAGLKYHNWITNESNINDGDFKYPRLEDYEKFAELIVRECALTAGLMEHEGRPNIGAQILDNFGVES
jgi:hypothetical protein